MCCTFMRTRQAFALAFDLIFTSLVCCRASDNSALGCLHVACKESEEPKAALKELARKHKVVLIAPASKGLVQEAGDCSRKLLCARSGHVMHDVAVKDEDHFYY